MRINTNNLKVFFPLSYISYIPVRLQKKKNIATLREQFIATLDHFNEATTKESIRASKETRMQETLIRATLAYDNTIINGRTINLLPHIL